MMLILVFIAGALRARSHHPFFWIEYGRWFARTPWQAAKPLPLGSIQLRFGDVVFLAAMVLALHNPYISAFRIPLVFLAGYLAVVCFGFWNTRTKEYAAVVTFGLGLVARLWTEPEIAASVAGVVYLITCFGLQRSLAAFPWAKAELLSIPQPTLEAPKTKSILTTEVSDLVIQKPRRSLGWPYELLRPEQPAAAISVREAAVASLLVAWWVYAIAANPMDPDGRKFLLSLSLSGFPISLSILCLGRYCTNYFPSIDILGRLFTLRRIIPGYDKVFVAPLLALVLARCAGGLIQELKVDPLEVVPIAVACTTMILLAGGPTLQDWRLTGHHRISPSDKSKTLIRI